MSFAAAHQARSDAKREAQAKVLAFLAQGLTVKAACAAAGRTYRAYEKWRAEDSEFRSRVDRLRSGNLDPSLKGLDFVRRRELFFGRSTPAHHVQMVEVIERAEPETVTMVLAPPDAAKTSLLVDYSDDTLAKDPNHRITVICEDEGLAEKILKQVRRRLEDVNAFGAFIEAFGPFKPPDRSAGKPWNNQYFQVLLADHDEKEPSMEARGAGSQIYGARIDLAVCDDIQSRRTLSKTEKLLEYLRQDVLTRMSEELGRVVILGSRVGVGDVYERLIEEDIVDDLVQIPALHRPVRRDEHFTKVGKRIVVNPELPDDLSYWPERWTMERLAKRRFKVGEDVWNRVYMQAPEGGELFTYTEAIIRRAFDEGRSIKHGNPFGLGTAMSVDPALGGWAGLMAAGFSHDRLGVLDVENIKGLARTEDLLMLIERFATKWRPSVCIIEEDGYGKGLGRDERLLKIARRLCFDVIPHETRRRKSDPVLGVGSMASAFIADPCEISIPYGDDESRLRMAGLVSELRKWRPDIPPRLLRQDLVMCLWFLWRWWMENRARFGRPKTKLWVPSWV